MPEFKAMMITCICLITDSISSTEPEICKETLVHILIANSSQKRTHIRKSSRTICSAIIKIVGIDQFRTQIETFEGNIIIVKHKELVSVPEGKAYWLVCIFVISGRNQASTDFATLLM